MKCLQGASAFEAILAKTAPAGLRVFVVWEKVLETDWSAPATSVLARIPDSRAAQFWDPNRTVSKALGETDFKSKVWDWAAVYPSGADWNQTPPSAIYTGRPVEDVAKPLQQALASVR